MKCLLCNEKAVKVHDCYTGYQLPQTFEIYSCDSCNTNFPMPRVNAKNIYDIIYKSGEKHPGYSRYFKFAEAVKVADDPLKYLEEAEPTYFAISESLRKKNIMKGAKVLEVGSGLGYLTYSLNKSGFKAFGLELSSVAVEQACQKFGDFYLNADLYEYSKTNNSSYDVVISTEVIEHVENPISFIKEMMKLLKPNGSLILTTPNKSFFPKGMIWESSLPPIHCWWFSEKSFITIGNILNLSVDFVNFQPFYSKSQPMFWNKDACINGPLPKAILNENGDIHNKEVDVVISNISIKNRVMSKILEIDIFKRLYISIKCNKETHIVTGEKCHYMGAVFTRK